MVTVPWSENIASRNVRRLSRDFEGGSTRPHSPMTSLNFIVRKMLTVREVRNRVRRLSNIDLLSDAQRYRSADAPPL